MKGERYFPRKCQRDFVHVCPCAKHIFATKMYLPIKHPSWFIHHDRLQADRNVFFTDKAKTNMVEMLQDTNIPLTTREEKKRTGSSWCPYSSLPNNLHTETLFTLPLNHLANIYPLFTQKKQYADIYRRVVAKYRSVAGAPCVLVGGLALLFILKLTSG